MYLYLVRSALQLLIISADCLVCNNMFRMLSSSSPGANCWSLVDDMCTHDDVIKWKHFPCYWPFVRGIQRSLVDFPHKGQWCGALMFSLICAWTNGWANKRDTGDLTRHRAHYDVTVMTWYIIFSGLQFPEITINTLWPSDITYHHVRWSSSVHVMACGCLHQAIVCFYDNLVPMAPLRRNFSVIWIQT